MFRDLKLETYRSFESYELRDLTRVNLLVGKNNCGKTSILEAVNLLVSKGNPSVIEQCADRRGEMNVREDPEPYGTQAVPDVSHLFYGRVVEPGICLHLSSNEDTRSLSIELADVDDLAEDAGFRDVDKMLSLFDEDTSGVLALVTKVDGRSSTPFLPVSEDGSVLAMPRSRRMRLKNAPAAPVVQFVTAESLYPEAMRGCVGQGPGRRARVRRRRSLEDPRWGTRHGSLPDARLLSRIVRAGSRPDRTAHRAARAAGKLRRWHAPIACALPVRRSSGRRLRSD